MDNSEMQIAAEAILFASGEPVHISRLCMALNTDRPRAEEALRRLGDYYAFERRGIRLVCMEDSYQLCSAPEYAEIIRKAFEIRKTAKLSQPALEVLAIVAYYQPVTRAQVDQIRGVDSAYTVGLLLDRKLIEECGRLQVPGRPRQYCTTQAFLRSFHLRTLEELPPLPGVEESGQLRLEENNPETGQEAERQQ
ncbi:MAG: SMC-Scp complex subunit ScpB [Oscillospiraceae bacterium]|nr:SMC-Scp complex subunit ScpB [Oscillospiraceae bacterium]MCI8943865.1 SMC-Scp complex subunit ScpB [Oscillospiraceae bacterium]